MNNQMAFGVQNDKPVKMPQHRVLVTSAGFLHQGRAAVVGELIVLDADVARDLVSRKLAEPSP